MIAADLRLARDVVANTVGLTLLVAVVAALLAAVELSGLERIGSLVVRIVPLLATMSAVRVAVLWQRSGRMLALASSGVATSRLCVVAGVAALGSGCLVVGAVSLLPESSGREWAFIGDELAINGRLRAGGATDIRLAQLERGQLANVGQLASAHWDNGWVVEGDLPPGVTLPSPEVWAAALARPARDVLAERLHAVLGGGLLAAIAMAMALRGRAGSAVTGSALWTLASGAALAVVATGALSWWAAVAAPLAVLLGGVIYASWTTA